MSQHARQKPHKCSQCGYTTVEKSHLTVHIRTHTGERPYTCRRCSYSSAQNCTLKSHYLRRHPGDQIDCNLCGSFYITEQERNNHQRSCRIVNGNSTTGLSMLNNSDHMELSNNHIKTAWSPYLLCIYLSRFFVLKKSDLCFSFLIIGLVWHFIKKIQEFLWFYLWKVEIVL